MEFIREMKCSICDAAAPVFLFSARDYISSQTFDLYRCAMCGAGQTEISPEVKTLSEYYGERYYGKRKGFVSGLINRARVRKVKSVIGKTPQPVVVDVGCGNGSLVCDLRKCGVETYGTEVAPVEHFQKDALPFIRRMDFKNSGFNGGCAHVVMLWHVLEHLSDPELYLAETGRVLKKGGSLIVEVPNFSSWQSGIFGANWLHLDVPRHLFHFSTESVRFLLKKSGFTEVRIRSGSFIYGYFGCLQSFLNVVSERKNLLFDFLNGKIGLREIVAHHANDFCLNILSFIPVLTLGAVLMFCEFAAGKSGIMLVDAKKG